MSHSILRTITVLVMAVLAWTMPETAPGDPGIIKEDETPAYTNDGIMGYVDDLMGSHAFYYESETGFGHRQRVYTSGQGKVLGESWGFEIDDYILDVNGDGLTDLVCNVVFGGDGHRECYVYTMDQGRVMLGLVDRSSFPDLYDWGANAMETWYDEEKGQVCVIYSSGQDKPETVYVDPDDLVYTEWP